jgi:hypothetical protein
VDFADTVFFVAGFLAAGFLAVAAFVVAAALVVSVVVLAAGFFFAAGALTATASPSGVATTRISEEAFNGAAAGLMGNKQ